MLESSPEILSLSEFFTVIGPDRAFGPACLDGRALWRLIGEQSADASALLSSASIPEVVARPSATHFREIPPLMLVTLPRLTDEPEKLHRDLRTEIEGLPVQPTAAQYSHVFEWLRLRFGKRVVVERSGGSLAYAGVLARLFPSARFIHICRDGPECAYSMSRHPYFRVLVTRLVRRNPDLSIAECLKLDVPADRYGAFWSATAIRGLAALNPLGSDRLLHVAFEQLCREPASTLRRIAEFLDLTDCDGLRQSASLVQKVEPRLPHLPPDTRNAIERTCRPGTRALAELSQVMAR